MMASVQSVQRGPSPPGPTAILSICCALSLLLGIEVPDEAAVDLELIQIVVGRHVAATVPAFVADAKKAHLIRSRMAVGGALLRQGRRLRGGQVFQPFGRFLRSAGADIDRQVRVGANLLEKVHEFVGAEGVRFDDPAPVGIEANGSWGADALAPVILIRETAAGPANVRHF